MWQMIGNGESPNVKTNKNLIKFVFISFISAVVVAVMLSFGLDTLNMAWGSTILKIVFLNDFGFSLLLGLPVFIVLTSKEIDFKTEKNNFFQVNAKKLLFKKIILTIIIASATVLTILVLMGGRLLYSPIMILSSIIFWLALADFCFTT